MNGISNKVSLTEGNIQNIDDENVTVAVSTDVPKELDKVEKDDKQSFEEFKTLYKDVITMKCKQDFGDCQDQKLWEDAAKELFLQSKNYILEGEEFKSKEDLQEEPEKEKKTENVIVTPQVIKENNENEFDDIKPGDEFVNEAGSKIVMLEPTETDQYNFKIINTNTNEEGTGKFSCTFMKDLLKDNHYKKVESKLIEKLNSNELITFSKKFLEAESEEDLEKLCNEIQFYSEPTYKRVKEIIDSEGSVQYKAQQISDILYQINDPKGLVESNDNDITYIFEQYDWKFDITTKDQLGSDYSYHTLVKTVDEAEKFNYHSDYWGDADTYQEEVVDVVRSFEPYIDEEVTITYDDGEKEKFKVIGVLIDKQYNSISHLKILVEPLGELKTEDHKSIKQLNATDFVSLIDNIKKMDLWDGKDETFKDAVEKYYSILDTQSKLKNEGTILSEQQLKEEADSPEFKYQLLDRLKSDCEYFLKAGNRAEKHLWAGNVDDQIAKMKELWNSLEEKPEWLSIEDIENYEKEMKQDTVEESKIEEIKTTSENTETYDAIDYFWQDEDIKTIQELIGEAANVSIDEKDKAVLNIKAPQTKYINGGIINGSDVLIDAITEYVHKQYPELEIKVINSGTTFILQDKVTWKSKKDITEESKKIQESQVIEESMPDDWYSEMFNKYVPKDGEADTTGGEILRLFSSISHMFFQNGDKIWRGNFANNSQVLDPKADKLHDLLPQEGKDLMEKMASSTTSSAYEKRLNKLEDYIYNYLKNNNNLFESKLQETYDISYHLAEYDKVLRGDNDTYCVKVENRTAQTETKWLLVDKAYVEKMKELEYNYKKEESKLNESKLSDEEIQILRKRMTDTVKQHQKFNNEEDLEKYIDEFMPMWIEMQQNLGTHLTEESIEEKTTLEEDKFFNLYQSFNNLYGINKMNPNELIEFINDLKKMNRISDKDFNVMNDYANKWQDLINKTGYESNIVNESKEVKTEDQYEAERRRGVPPIKRIAEQEVYDNEEWYKEHINDYLDITDFVNKNIYEIASEYNLRDTKAEEACKEIYKLAISLITNK